ncbi:MAG: hypothetical protein E4H27_07805, partial [Anaerolineales bacterium]
MRFAAMTFSFGPGSLESTLRAIKRQGFDCIDLAAGAQQQVDKMLAATDPRDQAAVVRKALAAMGMDISEVFLLHFDNPINHPDPIKRRTGRELFNGFVEFCREIGAESVMMSPGILYDEIGEAASLQSAVEELRYQQQVCTDHGLQLNMEPHWHSLAESPTRAQWFCEQVPGLGLTLDYSHFIAQDYTQDEIEPLHAYTRHFHARQAKTGATNVTLTEGVIDFHRILQTFNRDGWDGVVCLEYNPARIEDAPGEVARLKKQFDQYMQEDTNAAALAQGKVDEWNRIVFDPQWCRTCKLCEMVCSIEHEGESRPALSRININFDPFKVVNPIHGNVCAQCPDAPCLAVCPDKAMSRDAQSGAVIIDPDLCIGCMACRRACPWDIPKKHPELGIAVKCDLCKDRE